MKRAIFTAQYGNAGQYAWMTLPRIESYAKKLGCDFHMATEGTGGQCKDKWGFIEKAVEYDEVLWMDLDMIVPKDATSIFEAFPHDDIVARILFTHESLVATNWIRDNIYPCFDYRYYLHLNLIMLRGNETIAKIAQQIPGWKRKMDAQRSDQYSYNHLWQRLGLSVHPLPFWWNCNIDKDEKHNNDWLLIDKRIKMYHPRGGGLENDKGFPHKVDILSKSIALLERYGR